MSVSTTIKSIQDIMRKDAGVDGDAQRIGQLVSVGQNVGAQFIAPGPEGQNVGVQFIASDPAGQNVGAQFIAPDPEGQDVGAQFIAPSSAAPDNQTEFDNRAR